MFFDRTFHPDEANQAFTVGRLLETGTYTYSPTDHHGPALYYAAAPLQRAFGHTDTASLDGTLLRATPLVFAVLALVLGGLAVRRIARSRTTGGLFAVLLGSSPLFAFFATDFIQEILLAAFTLLMFFAGVNYFLPGRKLKRGTWALVFGIGAGLAFATKETSLVTFAAAILSALPFIGRLKKGNRVAGAAQADRQAIDQSNPAPRPNLSHPVLALLGFLLTATLLYSSFGQDFTGVYNAFIMAPRHYLGRAVGDAAASAGANWHLHPWWQYLVWLFAAKGFHHLVPAVFLLLFTPLVFIGRFRSALSGHLRALFLYLLSFTLINLAVYSAVPYKTPWCALQILVPYLLTAVLGFHLCGQAAAAYTGMPWARTLVPALLVALTVFCEHVPALRRIARDPDAQEIPYNYANASPEARQLAACVAEAVRQSDDRTPPLIAVSLPPEDTWPFPWYNRALEKHTGYWTKFEDLAALQKAGFRPTVVLVPMAEGHLVQPLFPHLKHTRRFYMRKGVRIRVFW